MLKPVRVLLVDDSVVIRRLVADALSADSRIEIVGTAPNGRIGLSKIERLKPEVVVLDVEMPVLDGLGTLAELRKLVRAPRVIMFSTITTQGAKATVEALALGAADYVTKPANVGSVAEAQHRVREELVPKVLALVRRYVTAERAAQKSLPCARPRVTPPAFRTRPAPVDVIVIGSSTGGPNALAEVISQLPSPLPVPLLIAQHMPPMFTKMLAARLDELSPLTVTEAKSGDSLSPDRAYVAPGGLHLSVAPGGLQGSGYITRVHDGPPENSCRPAVDVLFRSAVEAFGAHTLGVVLTGMGKDGLVGCELIKAAGGQVVSQDEETSVVWGMPGWVAKCGVTDRVAPISDISVEIERRLRPQRPGVGQVRSQRSA